MKVIKRVWLALMAPLLLSSCLETDKADSNYRRTVLVYIGADNNLFHIANSNIYSMNGSLRNVDDNTNLIVFVDRKTSDTTSTTNLLRLHDGIIDTLAKYPNRDSTDPMVMREVIDYVYQKYPSESYGLVLWSHGTGWLPTTQLHYVAPNMNYAQGRDGLGRRVFSPYAETPDTKAFLWEDRKGGDPKYSCMDLEEMKEAIPDGIFDYIAFDACYMGCVEVLYALRNKADYIISSCYEIVSYGFPYHIVTYYLTNGKLRDTCREFYDYYNSMRGWEQMGGISLVKTSELDSLANCFSKIVSEYRDTIPVLETGNIQLFDRFRNHVFYDLEDVVDKLDVNRKYLTEFRLQLEKCVEYKISTRFIFPGDRVDEIEVGTYCGLSVYIPLEKYDAKGLNDDYRKTDWSIDTGY
jgi:hypothetical protein